MLLQISHYTKWGGSLSLHLRLVKSRSSKFLAWGFPRSLIQQASNSWSLAIGRFLWTGSTKTLCLHSCILEWFWAFDLCWPLVSAWKEVIGSHDFHESACRGLKEAVWNFGPSNCVGLRMKKLRDFLEEHLFPHDSFAQSSAENTHSKDSRTRLKFPHKKPAANYLTMIMSAGAMEMRYLLGCNSLSSWAWALVNWQKNPLVSDIMFAWKFWKKLHSS